MDDIELKLVSESQKIACFGVDDVARQLTQINTLEYNPILKYVGYRVTVLIEYSILTVA
jgi:hypothetical protein